MFLSTADKCTVLEVDSPREYKKRSRKTTYLPETTYALFGLLWLTVGSWNKANLQSTFNLFLKLECCLKVKVSRLMLLLCVNFRLLLLSFTSLHNRIILYIVFRIIFPFFGLWCKWTVRTTSPYNAFPIVICSIRDVLNKYGKTLNFHHFNHNISARIISVLAQRLL